MINTLYTISMVMVTFLTVAYFYHIIYTAVALAYRKKISSEVSPEKHRFAALICARNEQAVIAELIESLKKQDYPSELLDIYVLADNCTDNTAGVAKAAGAIAYERHNKTQIGKGYALDYLFSVIENKSGIAHYDGYFIFDADNIVDPGFVREMNKTFCKGYNVITSYRNSKNYTKNWITYSYSVWFMHEARFINFPRMILGNGCAVSGTGFMVSSKIILENEGWPFHLLTEDIQFSVECAIKGCKIGYCDSAILYDEQPETLKQSWTQRMRWAKGFYQVDSKYLGSLAGGVITASGRRMTCYDIFMTVAPGMLFSLVLGVISVALLVLCINAPALVASYMIRRTVNFMIFSCLWAYFGLLLVGLMTVLSEWKRIHATTFQKISYLWAFPFFMATYIPISVIALFKKVEWKPIQHFSVKDSEYANLPEGVSEPSVESR